MCERYITFINSNTSRIFFRGKADGQERCRILGALKGRLFSKRYFFPAGPTTRLTHSEENFLVTQALMFALHMTCSLRDFFRILCSTSTSGRLYETRPYCGFSVVFQDKNSHEPRLVQKITCTILHSYCEVQLYL